MTNKEYIRWLKLLDDELTFDALVDGKDEMDLHEMIFDLCEKLEQEPILDKIRAEIEPKCDRINSLASVLPYTAHREIQELLCEIMDLCKAESESSSEKPNK